MESRTQLEQVCVVCTKQLINVPSTKPPLNPGLDSRIPPCWLAVYLVSRDGVHCFP